MAAAGSWNARTLSGAGILLFCPAYVLLFSDILVPSAAVGVMAGGTLLWYAGLILSQRDPQWQRGRRGRLRALLDSGSGTTALLGVAAAVLLVALLAPALSGGLIQEPGSTDPPECHETSVHVTSTHYDETVPGQLSATGALGSGRHDVLTHPLDASANVFRLTAHWEGGPESLRGSFSLPDRPYGVAVELRPGEPVETVWINPEVELHIDAPTLDVDVHFAFQELDRSFC